MPEIFHKYAHFAIIDSYDFFRKSEAETKERKE